MLLISFSVTSPVFFLLLVGALSPLVYLATVRPDADNAGEASITSARKQLDQLERKLRQERGAIEADIGDVKKLKKVTRSLEKLGE